MKERIFLCLLLATVSLLCSCSEQRYVPDSISCRNHRQAENYAI